MNPLQGLKSLYARSRRLPVRIRIAPVGYGSRVSLEDGPFPTASPGGLDAWAAAIGTWAEALTMLRAYLDCSVDVRSRR